jgi:glutamine cyclotransferase
MNKTLLPVLIAVVLAGCHTSNNKVDTVTNNTPKETPSINWEVVSTYPHDTNSFTEGFLVHKGELFESTGASEDLPQTRSLFGKVDLSTGKINVKVEIDKKKYFGEGITFLNGKVFQLTYKTKIGFVYDASTFKKIGEFTFPSKEGWGLTTDGRSLIMSDGTNTLTYLDPNSFQVIKTIGVSENGYAKDYLNELEIINGYIYANIWTTNIIVKIDPGNGKIIGKLDLTSLATESKGIYSGTLEMNGIAYDSTTNKVYVTGKLWPKIYEIRFDH